MTHARTALSSPSHPAGWRRRDSAHPRLCKVDHPRAIDRYIDYFGSGARPGQAATDACGEALLDLLDQGGAA